MSRKVVGSSSSSSSVSCASAIATQTRCRWPPDSCWMGRVTRSSVPVATSACATASSSASFQRRNQPWWGWPAAETRSPTVMPSGATGVWGSMPRILDTSRVLIFGECPVVEQDSAGPWLQQSGQAAQQGGLAAGVGPDDRGEAAVEDVQVQCLDDGAVVVAEAETLRSQPAGHPPTPSLVGCGEQPQQVWRADGAGHDAGGQFGGQDVPGHEVGQATACRRR